MHTPELKTCPFCGGPAELREQPIQTFDDTAWAFVGCKYRCPANPMTSGASSMGYRDYHGRRILICDANEALQKAIQMAAARWNTRAA